MFNSNLGEIVGHINCICLSKALSIAAIIYSLSNVSKTSCITRYLDLWVCGFYFSNFNHQYHMVFMGFYL